MTSAKSSVLLTLLALASPDFAQEQVTLLPSQDNTLYQNFAGQLTDVREVLEGIRAGSAKRAAVNGAAVG